MSERPSAVAAGDVDQERYTRKESGEEDEGEVERESEGDPGEAREAEAEQAWVRGVDVDPGEWDRRCVEGAR